ncbi:uncharacterized protein LOC142349763 [Convolutriloba macropyga]|uniref:uncharacterized protein LOC142349763 n=1 Tax=Convolutriloba macropyga TaxID=536237 RepID=UPI003F51C1AB
MLSFIILLIVMTPVVVFKPAESRNWLDFKNSRERSNEAINPKRAEITYAYGDCKKYPEKCEFDNECCYGNCHCADVSESGEALCECYYPVNRDLDLNNNTHIEEKDDVEWSYTME